MKYETDLRRKIMHAYRRCYWLTLNISPDSSSSPVGIPDLLCLGSKGRAVWIEVKLGDKGRLSPMQSHMIDTLRALGQRVVVARTLDEAVAPLYEEVS